MQITCDERGGIVGARRYKPGEEWVMVPMRYAHRGDFVRGRTDGILRPLSRQLRLCNVHWTRQLRWHATLIPAHAAIPVALNQLELVAMAAAGVMTADVIASGTATMINVDLFT